MCSGACSSSSIGKEAGDKATACPHKGKSKKYVDEKEHEDGAFATRVLWFLVAVGAGVGVPFLECCSWQVIKSL